MFLHKLHAVASILKVFISLQQITVPQVRSKKIHGYCLSLFILEKSQKVLFLKSQITCDSYSTITFSLETLTFLLLFCSDS